MHQSEGRACGGPNEACCNIRSTPRRRSQGRAPPPAPGAGLRGASWPTSFICSHVSWPVGYVLLCNQARRSAPGFVRPARTEILGGRTIVDHFKSWTIDRAKLFFFSSPCRILSWISLRTGD